MASILLNLLEEHVKNSQIGLPAAQLPSSINVSERDLDKLVGHFKREAGIEAEEFLLHSVDVAQHQLIEQQMVWDELDEFLNEYTDQVAPLNYSLHQPENTDSAHFNNIKQEPLHQYQQLIQLQQQQLQRISQHPSYYPHPATVPQHCQQQQHQYKQQHQDHQQQAIKKRQNFPKEATQILTDWLRTHYDHPYPSEQEKEELGKRAGLKVSQISGWMINESARRRKLKKDPVTHTFDFYEK